MSKKKPGKSRSRAKSRANGAVSRKAKPKASSPRSVTLPGMEQARDSTLIACCEDIAGARTLMNSARLDEQAAIQRAMKRLQAKPKDARRYRHAGVELALVEGVDKLRVRLTKDAEDTSSVGDAEVDDESNEAYEGNPGDDEEVEGVH
jgi:hypothetical protein